VLGERVTRDMIRYANKRQLDLQGCRAEQPSELGFRADFVRHEVEQTDTQWPYVLAHGVSLAHHHDTLGFKRATSREIIGNLDRHFASVLLSGTTRVA
jgi:hypothetical protein